MGLRAYLLIRKSYYDMIHPDASAPWQVLYRSMGRFPDTLGTSK